MGRRRGRRGGQGNRGRKSGRARGSVGGGKSKSKSSSSRGASSGRRGGQGNRGRTSTKNNAASNKGNRGGYGKGGASTGRRGGQGNKNTPTGRAKGTVTRTNLSKNLSKLGIGKFGRALAGRLVSPGMSLVGNVLNNPRVGQAIAQAVSNSPHVSDYNKDYRDKSTLTPQQLRQVERWEAKTGRDWEKRKEIGTINMSMADIARFAKLDQNDWKSKLYNALPSSIRDARINKTFYGNEKKKGWHSSQRPGRGHGVKKNILKINQGSQPNVTISKSTGSPGDRGPLKPSAGGGPLGAGIASLAAQLMINNKNRQAAKDNIKVGKPWEPPRNIIPLLPTPGPRGNIKVGKPWEPPRENINITPIMPTPGPGVQIGRPGPSNKDRLNAIYQEKLGRDAVFGKKGGADYWLDNHAQGPNVDWANIAKAIGASEEAKKYKLKFPR